MKNILLIFLCYLFIALHHQVLADDSGILKSSGEKYKAADSRNIHKQSSLSLYSKGLLYKNMALGERDKGKKEEYLGQALQYFSKAETYKESLDRIYNQMSICHLHQGRFSKALDYANKSINLGKDNIKPYMTIFRINLMKKKYPEASSILHKYLQVKPDSIRTRYILGEHYYSKLKNLKKSKYEFETILSISEKQPVLLFYKLKSYTYLGYISYKEMNFNKSAEYFKEAYKLDESDLSSIYFLANLYMLQYQIHDAEKYALLYRAKDPSNLQIDSILGRVKYLRHDPTAIGYLQKAGSIKSMVGLQSKGLYYELLNYDNQAEGLLRIVMKYQKDKPSVHMAFARIFERKKKYNEAFNFYFAAGILLYKKKCYHEAKYNLNKALLLKELPDVHYYLGRVHEDMKNHISAIRHYKIMNQSKYSIDIALHIGYLYGAKKRYKRAFTYFNNVIKKDPENHRAFFLKGMVSMWGKDYKGAQRNLEKAVIMNNRSESYYFYLAVVMEKSKNLNKAITYLKQAIKNDSRSARAYNYLGYIYADNNMNLNESFGLIQKAVKLEPENGAYIDSLGWIYFKKGNYKAALKNLLKAEKLLKKKNAPDAVVFDHLGDTYKMMGDYRKAIQYWNKAINVKEDKAIEQKIIQYKIKSKNGE